MQKLTLLVVLATAVIGVQSAAVVLSEEGRVPCLGCPMKISSEEAKKIFNFGLNQLKADGVDIGDVQIEKVISAYVQMLVGIKVEINADLRIDPDTVKTCNIVIHSQPWISENEYTIVCEGELMSSGSFKAKFF